MKRLMSLTIAGALVVGSAACSKDNNRNATNPNSTAARDSGSAVGTSGTSSADARFVDEQYAWLDVALAHLAVDRHRDVSHGSSPKVRE